MTDQARQHEAASILMAAVAGEASQDELAQLNQWIRDDHELAELVVEIVGQEAWLSWQGGPGVELATFPPISTKPAARQKGSQFAIAATLLIALGAAAGAVAMRWRMQSTAPRDLIAIDSPEQAESSRYVARFV